jgi:outer membrane receptor protein involved in Fe transport
VPGGAPLVGDVFPTSPAQMENLIGLPGSFSFAVQNGAGQDVMFNTYGQLVPIDYGTNPGGPTNATLFSSGGNGFAYIRDTSQALSNTERYNGNLLGHFDFNDHIRLFGEAWFSHSKSTDLTSQPEYNSGIFASAGEPAGNLILSVNNPYLTADQRALIENSIENNPLSDRNIACTFSGDPSVCGVNRPAQDYFYLSRASVDIPTGRSTYTDDLYRFVIGLNGKFNFLAGPWNWEISGNWGRSHAVGRTVDIDTQNFFNALGTITADNPNGVPCLAGLQNSPYPTISSTCTPFNPFGSGVASQAAMDYILASIVNISNNRQFVANGFVSGPLFKLPGGDLSVVVGAEHRAEGTDNEPSPFYHGGDDPNNPISYGQTVPIRPITGAFHTNEVFGELNADVISPANNISFIHSLDFQAAARYVDHSVAGGAVTWTAGGRYAPVRDISFRGNFTHAIRSPSIQEAFVPTSTFFGFVTDPCDEHQLGNGPDPATRQANCAAQGIPPDYVSQGNSRSFLQSTGGNPNLKNETSDAYSLGGVLTPRFVPGLNLSVDYVNVKLTKAISQFSADQVLDACYDAPNPASNPFCQLFTRDPVTHQVTFVQTSYYNASQLRYRGIIASWDYKIRTPFLGSKSSLGLSGSYQHLIELSSIASAGAAKAHNQGSLGYPKDSFVATINYLNGPLSLFTNFNYTGPVNQFADEPANFREFERIHSFLVINGGGSVDVNQRFRFFVDVDNIFNVKPPYPVPNRDAGGAVTYYPGIVGRYIRAGAGIHF